MAPMFEDASLEGGISKPTQCYHELCVLKHQSDVKRNWNFHVDETELILRLFRIVPFSPAYEPAQGFLFGPNNFD